MELPLAPRHPENPAFCNRPDTRHWAFRSMQSEAGQRNRGMPPSVALPTLMDEPSQAMKKGPSHRPCGRFSRDCCVKNTQPFWACLDTRVRAAKAADDREKPFQINDLIQRRHTNKLHRHPLSRRNYRSRRVASVRRPSDVGLTRPAPRQVLRGPVAAIRGPLIRLKTCDLIPKTPARA